MKNANAEAQRSIHPFFDFESDYHAATSETIEVDMGTTSVQRFFEELRRRRLYEEWQDEVPQQAQDFGYSPELNQLIHEELLESQRQSSTRKEPVVAESMPSKYAMAAPAEDDSGLVLLDLTEKQTPRLLRSGSFEDFGVEVYTGLSPRGRSVLVDGFRLRLPSSLMLDGPRPNVRVVSLILSPKRIEQLKELNRELANQDSEDNQPNETVLRAVNAENLQDFARRGTNPSRASRYFEIFREVPTLAGTTDQNGSLDWSVPLLRPSPKLEPGSWVAVCFGPADRT